MGFLQGIIADARPVASATVTDVNIPVIARRGERLNSPLSGGITSGEVGMQESGFDQSFGSGIADPGRGSSPVDRQLSAVSTLSVDTTHSSRHDSITTENQASASGHDERSRAALSVNVEYHETSYPAETNADLEVEPSVGAESSTGIESSTNNAEPSVNYREPSVFSVMPVEVHDAFQNDSLSSDTPLLSSHGQAHIDNTAHEKIASESLSHAGEFDNSDTDNNASPTYQRQPLESGIARQKVSKALAVERTSDYLLPPEKNERPGTHTGPVSTEKFRQPLSAGREAKQPGAPASSNDLSQSISAQEITRASSNKTKRDIPLAEVNRLQDQAAITTDSQRVAQTEVLVSGRVRQQPARQPNSPFTPPPPVQKAPEVKIGQVDVFIEAPRKEVGPAKRSHKVSQAFSSRHYLRRV